MRAVVALHTKIDVGRRTISSLEGVMKVCLAWKLSDASITEDDSQAQKIAETEKDMHGSRFSI